MNKVVSLLGFGLICISSCTFESPEVPDTDIVLEGTYVFQSADNANLAGTLEGADIEFHTDGSFQFTNPGWTNDELGTFDIMESGTYGFQEVVENSGFLSVDIISQVPPQLSSLYTFHGGLNRIRYGVETESTSEILNLYISYGEDRYWAAFAKAIPVNLEGTYVFTSSADSSLIELLTGAELSFDAGMFELTNPVTVEISHQDTTIWVVERGPFSTTIDSITFELYSQEPEGADSLFALMPPSVTAALSLEDGTLSITLPGEGRDGTTYWSAPSTVEETEPNDTRSEATIVSGTGQFGITGEVSAGGIDNEGDYSGDYDYYQFVTTTGGTFSGSLTWSEPADLDLFLLDRTGATIAFSSTAGQSGPEDIEYSVIREEAYYLLVVSADNPASYSVDIRIP